LGSPWQQGWKTNGNETSTVAPAGFGNRQLPMTVRKQSETADEPKSRTPEQASGATSMIAGPQQTHSSCPNDHAFSSGAQTPSAGSPGLASSEGGATLAAAFRAPLAQRHPWREDPLGVRHRQPFRLVEDVPRYPLRKRGPARAMSTGPGVLVPKLGQLFLPKTRGTLDECWPKTTVDVRHLAFHQLAHQHVTALTDGIRNLEDLVTLRMRPPATSNGAASDSFGKARHGTSCSLQGDAVTFYEGQCLSRAHQSSADTVLSVERYRLTILSNDTAPRRAIAEQSRRGPRAH
jgi:hypothetical protein